ncbi:MAG: DUF927 domain-containing protein [Bryobacteraceae bacterium]
MPDQVIGAPKGEEVMLQRDLTDLLRRQCRGTLDEWRENVATVAIGNSRLAFAISSAFAAPLLNRVGRS